jgi:hypothetical protein
MTIQEIIQRLADKGQEVYGLICEVVSVDTEKRSCEVKPINGTANIEDVRIQASYELQEGFWIKPKVGSFVVVNFLDNNNAYIVLTEKIEEFAVKIEGTELLIKNDKVIFNEGAFGGLIKIELLTAKLNDLKDAFNTFVSTFNSHIHTTTATVGASPTPGMITPTQTTAQNASAFDKSDYENTKITHG